MPMERDNTPALHTPDYWDTARRSLARKDKIMARIIRSYRGETLIGGRCAFETIARSVVGQQISVKAAASIWAAMEKRFTQVTPEKIARCRKTTLRSCGLSESKADYMKNIAAFFIAREITPSYWKKVSAADARAQLLAIKGVGEWTWQMFAIFYLKQPDILPLGDLGLVGAIRKSYGENKKLEQITDAWRPWRTVATWYLWRSIDPEPVSY